MSTNEYDTIAQVNKQTIRKKLLKLRENQSLVLKSKKDKKIIARLLRFKPFRDSQEFFTYITHRGEVSTDFLLRHFLNKKRIIVPKIHKRILCLFELHDTSQFIKGTFGIREPKICLARNELKHIEVALIPGIAFDTRGHRIGFGGGYFDRLLKKLHCTTIGLAYEFQIIEKVPTHTYDVAVDYIVTEKRIIKCGKRGNVM